MNIKINVYLLGVIIAIFLVLHIFIFCDKENVCNYVDVTPNDLIGAIHWEERSSDEVVICPVVSPEYVTQECREIEKYCI